MSTNDRTSDSARDNSTGNTGTRDKESMGSYSRDTTVTKIDSATSPVGPDGEVYLASGKSMAMRMWRDEQPADAKPMVRRDYETVGYVLSGRAELQIEGQTVTLEPGNSWVVPRGAEHTYRILETFSAVEATHPPYHVHGRED